MWNKLGKLNKLKDLAVDMVAPRHLDDGDDDDYEHEPPTRGRTSGAPRPGDESSVDVQRLQAEIQRLEEEKSSVILQAQQYSAEVKKNYEQTVSYYESKLRQAEAEWLARGNAEAERVRQSLTEAYNTLEGRHAALTAEHELLVQETAELKRRHLDTPTPGVSSRNQLLPHADEKAPLISSSLEDEVALLRSQLEVRSTFVSPEEFAHLQTSLLEKSAEIDALRSAEAALSKAHIDAMATLERSGKDDRTALLEEMRTLKEQHAAMQFELGEARAKLDDGFAAAQKSIQAQLDEERQSNALLRQHIERQRVNTQDCLPQSDSVVTTSPDHDRHTRRQSDSAVEELQSVKEDIGALQQERDELKQRCDALSHCCETLQAELLAQTESRRSAELVAVERQARELAEVQAVRAVCDAQLAASKSQVEVCHSELEAMKRAVNDRESAARTEVALLQTKAERLTEQLAATQADLNTVTRRLESEASTKSYGEQTVNNLRATIGALEEECERLRSQRKQTLQECSDIVKGITLPLTNGESTSPPTTTAAFSVESVLVSIVRELHAQQEALSEASKLHKQWEQTYQQAKEVNATVNKQLSDAQRQVQELRTELASRDRAVAALQSRLKEDQSKWQDAQVNLSAQHQYAQRFEAERADLKAEMSAVVDAKEAAIKDAQQLKADVEDLRSVLQDREEELTTCQRSLSNLQMVLEQFQRSKQREVDEQTLYLQHELDTLRSEFSAAEALKQRHREELQAASSAHRKELATKNVAVSGLQAKLVEMKRILEETASQLSDEHMIDKRVVSHLVVNFVHSIALDRGDSDDMLKVMSGLLNWDDVMQQKAGLLPGPLNPKRGGGKGSLVGGFVRSVWGGMGRQQQHPSTVQIEGTAATMGKSSADDGARPSIAEMWVEFLLKEGGATKDGATTDDNDDSTNGHIESSLTSR